MKRYCDLIIRVPIYLDGLSADDYEKLVKLYMDDAIKQSVKYADSAIKSSLNEKISLNSNETKWSLE